MENLQRVRKETSILPVLIPGIASSLIAGVLNDCIRRRGRKTRNRLEKKSRGRNT
jgi:hypothetical protein